MNGPEKSQPMTILLWAQFFHVRLQCCRAGWAVWCPNAWISVNSIGVFSPWEKPSSYWGTIDGNHHQWILMLYVYMYIYIYLLYMCVCKKMFEFVILCCKFFLHSSYFAVTCGSGCSNGDLCSDTPGLSTVVRSVAYNTACLWMVFQWRMEFLLVPLGKVDIKLQKIASPAAFWWIWYWKMMPWKFWKFLG